MTMRVFVALLAATAVVLVVAACAPGSSTEGESSESDSFWDRTVGSVTDGIGGPAELSEYVSEDTMWPTEDPDYTLRPEDFAILPFTDEMHTMLTDKTYGGTIWTVFDAGASECVTYLWDEGSFGVGDNPPQEVVVGTLSLSQFSVGIDAVYQQSTDVQYKCTVPKEANVRIGVPKHLLGHVNAAMNSYQQAAMTRERAQSVREDKEVQLDRVLARYCFNPPCKVANYDSLELGIAYSWVDEPDREAFQDYNEAVYDLDEAQRARQEARRDAQCWVISLLSTRHIDHFPRTCGSPTAEATATAVAPTSTPRPTSTPEPLMEDWEVEDSFWEHLSLGGPNTSGYRSVNVPCRYGDRQQFILVEDDDNHDDGRQKRREYSYMDTWTDAQVLRTYMSDDESMGTRTDLHSASYYVVRSACKRLNRPVEDGR